MTEEKIYGDLTIMKKIYGEEDKFDRVLYSESYMVRFSYETPEGICARGSVRYYAAGKNSHRQVEGAWRRQYPKAALISISYE